MDSRMYPVGKDSPKSILRPGGLKIEYSVPKSQRTRVTVAQLNAGFTLLPATPGVRWRITDFTMITIGGNATSGTSANIVGTRAASAVQIAAVATAALTRSAVVRAGATNAVVLADGASFTQLDGNTAVTCITVGSAMTVMTHLDITLGYVADPL